jgi:hypothetical protein
MKHGFLVVGRDSDGEFTYGSNDRLSGAIKDYKFAMKSPHVSDEIKKTLRVVELVEKEIEVTI